MGCGENELLPPVPAHVAAELVEPFFDACMVVYSAPAEWHPPFTKLRELRWQIEPEAHDTPRHFAGCRDDGKLLLIAPEVVHLPAESLVAILAHEFGHALDFLYPGAWTWPMQSAGPVSWIGEDSYAKASAWRQLFGKSSALSRNERDDAAPAANWGKRWVHRTVDEEEWAADGIAWAVTGRRPLYGGSCMVQRFSGGVPRPVRLR